ncbi:MAG TPA: peptidyl-alpha-hydroxyglycine alpha-amidating lyase family protein [Flavilitoribacter sp.]|nr:peptidyl-alpha-hydroxyglycine alpha-amidating lyase family protein [Flavilitoribacter sp.]HMQ86325.1 peptidyl-alpha-hydroxyglycine alpha-amidating lyase family protein [Flavilitoribacter sp.]
MQFPIRTCLPILALLLCFNLLYAQKTGTLSVVPGFIKTAPDANIITPTGVAVDKAGNIYITNAGPHKLLEFDRDGNYLRSLLDGVLVKPHGVRVDREGFIWVTDLELHVVLKVAPSGQIAMVLGQLATSGEQDPNRKTVMFFKPADIAFDPDGNIFVADGYGNSRVVKLDKNGNFIKAWGQKGPEPGNFDNPHNVIIDRNNRLYVADRYNKRIQIFDLDGKLLDTWTHLGIPWGLAYGDDGMIYMSDGNNEKILVLDTTGKILNEYENPGQIPGALRAVHGITTDSAGNIYVTEVMNWRVEKFVRR